jgi:hypothetical protein
MAIACTRSSPTLRTSPSLSPSSSPHVRVSFGEKGTPKHAPARDEPVNVAQYKAPSGPTTRCRITFRDAMPKEYLFVRWQPLLDGAALFPASEDKAMAAHVNNGEPVHVDVDVGPGEHTLHSVIEFWGNGAGYWGHIFKIPTSRSFTTAASLEIALVAYEQNTSAPVEERPAVRYEAHTLSN